jgi:hypothetical protein
MTIFVCYDNGTDAYWIEPVDLSEDSRPDTRAYVSVLGEFPTFHEAEEFIATVQAGRTLRFGSFESVVVWQLARVNTIKGINHTIFFILYLQLFSVFPCLY